MPEGDSNTRYWRVQRTRPSIVASPGVEGRINLRWDPQEGSKIPCATRRDEETRRRQRREATTTCGTVQECSAGSVHESGNVRRDAANMLRIARSERGKAPRRRARRREAERAQERGRTHGPGRSGRDGVLERANDDVGDEGRSRGTVGDGWSTCAHRISCCASPATSPLQHTQVSQCIFVKKKICLQS